MHFCEFHDSASEADVELIDNTPDEVISEFVKVCIRTGHRCARTRWASLKHERRTTMTSAVEQAFQGWVIERDLLTPEGTGSRVGYGQRTAEAGDTNASFEAVVGRTVYMATGLQACDVVNPISFRLKDDDGEVYFEGKITKEWIDGEEELAFAPLRFGETDAGCTTLEYNEGNGWKVL
jgi:hypothetical protein